MGHREATSPVTKVPAITAAHSSQVGSLVGIVLGQLAEVVEVRGDDALAHRLVDSGLWPGAVVELIGRAPFGDPLLFRLHGYRLALRRGEAERVGVRGIGDAP